MCCVLIVVLLFAVSRLLFVVRCLLFVVLGFGFCVLLFGVRCPLVDDWLLLCVVRF